MLRYYSDTVFTSSGQALGLPWVQLKQGTIDEKTKNWPGRGILQRSGALQGGFTDDITPVSLYISNTVPYFKYNQLGTGYKGLGGKGVGRGRKSLLELGK